jgi:acetyl esterase/lipase
MTVQSLGKQKKPIPSFQYHLFKPLMRIARWSQGNFPVQDANAFVRFRQLADRVADVAMHPPRDVKVESDSLGGVAGDWIIPTNTLENPVMLFLHGGGIAFGWNNPLRRELAYLAGFAGLRAFGVDYHLIPEYIYPVAHDECYAVYRALLQQGKQIVLIGESSGAVLALAILLRAKAEGIPQPLLCALISPVVDYGFKDARVWQSDDPFAHPKFTVEMHNHYVAGNDTMLPDLGPVYADLDGIASLYVMAGENEIMRSEVERLAQATQRYKVPIEILLYPHVWHSWHALAPQLPEATRALEALGTAIRQRVSKYR